MRQEENWKPIPGYEGIYEISDLARIRSVDRSTPNRNGHVRPYLGKVMTTQYAPDRPQTIILSKNGNRKCEKVDQLVLRAFIDERGKDDTVMYRDGDPSNNQLFNLRWSYDISG